MFQLSPPNRKSFRLLLTFPIILLFIINGCKEGRTPIYQGGHESSPARNLVPEPDLKLRLKYNYNTIKSEENNTVEEYLVSKRISENFKEFDVVILRNEKGQIVSFEEFSSDLYLGKSYEIIQTYFFDKYGRTFAIEQRVNSVCKGLDAHQTIVKYYNASFHQIDSVHQIAGTEGEEIVDVECRRKFDNTLGAYSTHVELVENMRVLSH